jgi:hypothetical protein
LTLALDSAWCRRLLQWTKVAGVLAIIVLGLAVADLWIVVNVAAHQVALAFTWPPAPHWPLLVTGRSRSDVAQARDAGFLITEAGASGFHVKVLGHRDALWSTSKEFWPDKWNAALGGSLGTWLLGGRSADQQAWEAVERAVQKGMAAVAECRWVEAASRWATARDMHERYYGSAGQVPEYVRVELCVNCARARTIAGSSPAVCVAVDPSDCIGKTGTTFETLAVGADGASATSYNCDEFRERTPEAGR